MAEEKKLVISRAIQFTKGSHDVVGKFIGQVLTKPKEESDDQKIVIQIPGGSLTASLGDYVVQDVNGEYHVCGAEAFEAHYRGN